MYHVLLVIHVIITVAMIAVILLQRSASDGLSGIGGGGGGGFMTSRGQANLLTRMTAILATLFIANSLALGWLTHRDVASRSIADQIIERQREDVIAVPTPDDVKSEVKAESETTVPAKEVTKAPKKAEEKTPASSEKSSDKKAQ